MIHSFKTSRLWLLATAMLCTTAFAQGSKGYKHVLREKSEKFFRTDEARRIGDQLLLYQRCTGGWPKNIDMVRPLNASERKQIEEKKKLRYDSTTDNGATTMQLTFLARLWQQTNENKYSEAFQRGIEYLLSGQYQNGGWPQFWPGMRDYQVHITYNDDAMAQTMLLLRDVAEQRVPYQGNIATEKLRKKAQAAFDKGIECILATQITDADGTLTVWCQQHDYKTLKPTKARAYELPSYCTQESATLVGILMDLPNPDDRVKRAVHAAMTWFEKHKLTGLRIVRRGFKGGTKGNTELVKDDTAGPLWARYYDLEKGEPFVCDRDGIPRKSIEELSKDRRNGYAWYNDRPAELYDKYRKWSAKWGTDPMVSLTE
jgi:PelA/Pel-15E family pectate lyase